MFRFLTLIVFFSLAAKLQAQTIAAGASHSSILRYDTLLVSWGSNSNGQLGVEGGYNRLSPTSTSHSFVSISSGNTHTIALKADGSLWEWGLYLASGQIANPDMHDPIRVGTKLYTQISAGFNHSLAIDTDGHLWAWGTNNFGQIGDNTTDTRTEPVQIGTQKFTKISAGSNFSLALDENGHLWSWGRNNFRQLGSGDTTPSLVPINVSSEVFTHISAGGSHSFAIHADGTLWGWGIGTGGALGNTSLGSAVSSPVRVNGDQWKTAHAGGGRFSVGIKNDGTLWAWGQNFDGSVGNGTTTNQLTPVQISNTVFTEVAVGSSHTLAKAEDGTIYAWGANTTGAVGNASSTRQLTPDKIINSLFQIPPGTPQNVFASACNMSALVSWTAPQDNGSARISAYHIESQTAGSSEWIQILSTAPSVNRTTVPDLENGTGVSFRVAAENLDGTSEFSSPTSVVVPANLTNPCGLGTSGRWLTAGSLHSFYMSSGMEREHALVASQQYGMRWPAIHPYQDAVASKGLWIGTQNFTNVHGVNHEYKVIAVGPRDNGIDSFFPIEHKLVSRFQPTFVTVNGEESFDLNRGVDEVDPSLPSDQMIYTKVHTSIGLMVERRNYQWSNADNDNYHIQEYVFTNNGATGFSPEVTLPNNTLEGVYITLLHRYAPVRQTRYVIGNSTGWGTNTMNDRFGDGLGPNYGLEGTSLRGSFSWHGRFPNFTNYDNIGGPIWSPGTSAGFVSPSDTTGRLGAYHFIGYATLHADTSPASSSDNLQQPSTMSHIDSDNSLLVYGQMSPVGMMMRYNLMKTGRTTRHAYLVEPSGTPGFLSPTSDPSLGNSGGNSHLTSYGPYTIAPGESVRFVVVEAVSGISREQALITGQQFKRGDISALQKNEVVFQGRDSLMQTFVRAKSNFEGAFNLPQTPPPPTVFEVSLVESGIGLSWEYDSDAENPINGFSIWRTSGAVDNPYIKVAELSAESRSFIDSMENPIAPTEQGVGYYYYITADGDLSSGRYFTQTYDSAQMGPVSVENHTEFPYQVSLFQNYPNPFNPQTTIRYELSENTRVRLAVFDVMGRKVASLVDLDQTMGQYSVDFDASRLASGVYIYQLSTGKVTLNRKMLLIK